MDGFSFELGSIATADIQISYLSDGYCRGGEVESDGPGEELGHTFSPRPANGKLRGALHLDGAESWVLEDRHVSGEIDMQTVLIHEIGHALGLDHIPQTDSVMYELYHGVCRKLADADIQEFHRIYPEK
jgi:hypothetical protein